ncbi:MAG: PIN domain-containing protein [Actinomycetota bacterium]
MSVLDAFALCAMFLEEAAADEVRTILRSRPTYVAAINLAETYDRLIRTHAVEVAELDLVVEGLVSERSVQIVPLDREIARRSGLLRAANYQRRGRSVSLADCVAVATAESIGQPIVTSDEPLAHIARSIDVDVIALPDSTGTRP